MGSILNPISSIAGGVAGVAGQSLANTSNERIARENREFQAREAMINRQFQERLSSTAVQRSAADMRSAGFNPLLSIARPSSTPSGGQASGSALPVGNIFGKAGETASQLLQSYALRKQKAEISLLEQQAALATSSAKEREAAAFRQYFGVGKGVAEGAKGGVAKAKRGLGWLRGVIGR